MSKPDPSLNTVAALQGRLDELGVKYFRATELLRIRYPEKARGVGITTRYFLASARVLAELANVAILADRIRTEFGGPLTVLNGYRPHAYNKVVTTATLSQHIFGRAIDLTCSKADMPRLRTIAEGMWRSSEFGGFGSYRGNIHVDTRPGHRGWGSQLGKVLP